MRLRKQNHWLVRVIGCSGSEGAEFSLGIHNHDLTPSPVRHLGDYEKRVRSPVRFTVFADYAIEFVPAIIIAKHSRVNYLIGSTAVTNLGVIVLFIEHTYFFRFL